MWGFLNDVREPSTNDSEVSIVAIKVLLGKTGAIHIESNWSNPCLYHYHPSMPTHF